MYQKEYIKDRMLKDAALAWDIKGVVNEDSFDPIVNMLITALASESELIYREIELSQDRVAKRLVSKLVPEVNAGVMPGHLMVLLNPVEDYCTVDKYTEFSAQVRMESNSLRNVKFVSLRETDLFKGDVVCVATHINKYRVVDNRFKVAGDIEFDVPVCKSNELLIGVKSENGLAALGQMPLMVELGRSNPLRNLFYEQLSRADFFCNDRPIVADFGKRGSGFSEEKKSVLGQLEDRVHDFYAHQLVYLDVADKSVDRDVDHVLEEKNSGDCIDWIKVVFQDDLDSKICSDVFFYTNVVPLVNLELCTKIYQGNKSLNVLEIKPKDDFYCINNVYTDGGRVFREYDGVGAGGEESSGVYMLRRDEVSGFSSSAAKGLLQFLLGKLRNENAVFAGIGKGNLVNDLKLMNQIMKRMDLSIDSVTDEEQPLYVFLLDKDSQDHVFVEYYETNSELIRNMKINTPVQVSKGGLIQQTGNFTITPVSGVRGRLTEEQQFYHVRHAMLSNDRIVSSKDVSSLVHKYLGSSVKRVEVKRGMQEGTGVKEGYVRTVDVCVSLHDVVGASVGLDVGKQILCELEEKGMGVFPYRVFINKELVQK